MHTSRCSAADDKMAPHSCLLGAPNGPARPDRLRDILQSKMSQKKNDILLWPWRVIPVSERLVDVDILELSESPCSSVGICSTRMGLGRRMAKELDLKLTLGLTERR